MKHTLYIATLLLLLSACTSNERKTIEKVAYDFNYALATYDIDAATPLATPETQESYLKLAKAFCSMVDSNYIKSDRPVTIEITNVEIVNDTVAQVSYHKTSPHINTILSTELRKRNGKWLAHEVLEQQQQPATPQPTNSDKDSIKTYQL